MFEMRISNIWAANNGMRTKLSTNGCSLVSVFIRWNFEGAINWQPIWFSNVVYRSKPSVNRFYQNLFACYFWALQRLLLLQSMVGAVKHNLPSTYRSSLYLCNLTKFDIAKCILQLPKINSTTSFNSWKLNKHFENILVYFDFSKQQHNSIQTKNNQTFFFRNPRISQVIYEHRAKPLIYIR